MATFKKMIEEMKSKEQPTDSAKVRRKVPEDLEGKARKAWQEHLKYVLADPTDENIEKGNRTGEEFANIVHPYLSKQEVDKWDTISGTYKDPQEEWDYLADVFGWQK